jgi:hypothetical protein
MGQLLGSQAKIAQKRCDALIEHTLSLIFSKLFGQEAKTLLCFDDIPLAVEAKWLVLRDRSSRAEAAISFIRISQGSCSQIEYFKNLLDLTSALGSTRPLSGFLLQEKFSYVSPIRMRNFLVYAKNKELLAKGMIADPMGVFSAIYCPSEVSKKQIPLVPNMAHFELIFCFPQPRVPRGSFSLSKQSNGFFLKAFDAGLYSVSLQMCSKKESINLILKSQRGVMTANESKEFFRCSVSLGDIEMPAESVADLRPGAVIEINWQDEMDGILKLEGEDWARVRIRLSETGYQVKIIEF